MDLKQIIKEEAESVLNEYYGPSEIESTKQHTDLVDILKQAGVTLLPGGAPFQADPSAGSPFETELPAGSPFEGAPSAGSPFEADLPSESPFQKKGPVGSPFRENKMKVSKDTLKQIVKEETKSVLNERLPPYPGRASRGADELQRLKDLMQQYSTFQRRYPRRGHPILRRRARSLFSRLVLVVNELDEALAEPGGGGPCNPAHDPDHCGMSGEEYFRWKWRQRHDPDQESRGMDRPSYEPLPDMPEE